MNIINKCFLQLALLPKGLYRKMGIDIRQLKAILHTKLLMDDRRPNTFHQTQRRKEGKEVRMSTLGTMFISAVMGMLYLFAFYFGSNLSTSLTVYFSLFFFMLSATLMSDFTSVLIDVRDTYIILPRPVSDTTMIAGRLLHIGIHISKIVWPMALPGMIYLGIREGFAAALLLIIYIAFVTLFTIFFINAVYLLILRITTPQKFQSIIAYVQVVFAIVMYGSYQVFPRLMRQEALQLLDLKAHPLSMYYPLYWFGHGFDTLFHLQGTATGWISVFLAMVLPLVSIWLVIRFLAPSFNNKLALISGATASPPASPSRAGKGSAYAGWLSRLFTQSPAEKMGFLFTWKLSARSRDFKLKVYPAIGYLLVYVVIIFVNSERMNLDQVRQQDARGKVLIISALYFTSLLLTMAINQMVYSEKHKAAWIFHTAPLQKPGEVILGSAKAAILRFYIPIVLAITLAGTVLAGPSILPNIILGLSNELLIATILVYAGNRLFPFSVHQGNDRKTGSFIRNLAVLLISGFIAIGHFLIYDFMAVVIIASILSIGATWLLMGSIRNTDWSAMKSSYADETAG